MIEDYGLLSPITNFMTMAKYVARTSAHDRTLAGEAGRRYHADVIAWLEESGRLRSWRWFTDDSPDQEPLIANPETVTEAMLATALQARSRWVAEQQERAQTDNRRRLDVSGLPRFGLDWQASVADSVGRAVPGLVVLVLSLGLSVLVTAARFLRMDPR